MNKNLIEKFDDAYEKYLDSVGEVRKVCIEMLTEVCNRTDSKEISLDKLKDWCYDSGEGCPTVSYDGGNHPEYASNCYSSVDGICIKHDPICGDKLFLDIEDDTTYSVDRVLTVDLIGLCDVITMYETTGECVLGVSDYGDDE
jgi:hypothetical protein